MPPGKTFLTFSLPCQLIKNPFLQIYLCKATKNCVFRLDVKFWKNNDNFIMPDNWNLFGTGLFDEGIHLCWVLMIKDLKQTHL